MFRTKKNKQPIIFVMGGPGSGKGTQCDKLKALNYHHIAMGDILRRMIQENQDSDDPFIKQLIANMKSGVSTGTREGIEIIRREMAAHPEAAGFLIDGYPRTPAQLARFEREIGACDKVLYLDTTEEMMQQRILARADSAHRIDDNKETAIRRIQQFKQNTKPMIEALRRRNNVHLLQVDTSGSIEDVFQHIVMRLSQPKVKILGVAGQSGSGKTTIANKLTQEIKDCAIISIDNYYKDLSDLSPEERQKCNFDHPDSIDFDLLIQHLLDLMQGKSIEVPIYDFNEMIRKKETIHIAPKRNIIVEGILSLYPKELRQLFDAKIYIDTDADVCLIRRILRDQNGSRPVADIFSRYLKDVKPMSKQFVYPAKGKADFVLDNNSKSDDDVARLLAFLKRKGFDLHSTPHIHQLFPPPVKHKLLRTQSLSDLQSLRSCSV
jgi:uridine kinase